MTAILRSRTLPFASHTICLHRGGNSPDALAVSLPLDAPARLARFALPSARNRVASLTDEWKD